MIKQSGKLKAREEIKAYFTAGSLEHDTRGGSMINDLKSFYISLPKAKFESKLEIIDGGNHVSMVPAALTKGFKYLFGK